VSLSKGKGEKDAQVDEIQQDSTSDLSVPEPETTSEVTVPVPEIEREGDSTSEMGFDDAEGDVEIESSEPDTQTLEGGSASDQYGAAVVSEDGKIYWQTPTIDKKIDASEVEEWTIFFNESQDNEMTSTEEEE